jgi:hypothetical protein
MVHHLTAVVRDKSPVFAPLSSCSTGRAHPLTTPASRRLLMLMLPRLRTRGSLIRSFSDSARWRCELVSPADVRLKMARRPRREAERVGTAAVSLVAFIGHWVTKSLVRRFFHGDDEYGGDTALGDANFESGEEETFGTVAEE